jgi:hypothetical protein
MRRASSRLKLVSTGHAQQPWALRAGMLLQRFARGREHLRTAGGVNRQQARAQVGGANAGFGDDMGDIVELEVKEDALAAVHQPADHLRPGGGEELRADFEQAGAMGQELRQLPRLRRRTQIQSHDDARARGSQLVFG